MRKIRILLLALLLAGCATLPREERQAHRIRPAARSVADLRAELESIFNDPSFDNAFWGVSIKSLANGQTIYTRNEARFHARVQHETLFHCGFPRSAGA
jgi:PBP1b-binding outer membrane lipoprotein LpoB